MSAVPEMPAPMMTTAASVWVLFPIGTCGHGCEPPMLDLELRMLISVEEGKFGLLEQTTRDAGTFYLIVIIRCAEHRASKSRLDAAVESIHSANQHVSCRVTARIINARVFETSFPSSHTRMYYAELVSALPPCFPLPFPQAFLL